MMIYFLAVLTICYTTCVAQITNIVDDQNAKFRDLIAQEVASSWATADINHNHRFDMHDMDSIFNDYDKDHNQQVCETEWMSQYHYNDTRWNIVGRGLFLELDMDRNGCISHHDLQLFLTKIDTNNDNRVDDTEFKTYFTEILTVLYVVAIETGRTTMAIPLVS